MLKLVSAKQCPQCGIAASLSAGFCDDCGHQYRTCFTGPVESTQIFPSTAAPLPQAVLPATAPQPRRVAGSGALRLALWSLLIFVSCAGAVCLFLQVNQPSAIKTVKASSLPAVDPARQLYESIGISMSLYDLDQAAGSVGRVLPDTNPQMLLLAFDYPGQSVHVMLLRADPANQDYRVHAAALYRGGTQLQHMTDLN